MSRRAARDPLYRDVRFSHVLDLSIMDVGVRFECDGPVAARQVARAYRRWRGPGRRGKRPPARCRVVVRIVRHRDAPSGRPRPFAARMPDNERLLLQGEGGLALADVARGEGVIYAGPALLRRGPRFIESLLDPVVLLLVTHDDRVPLHATMVMRGRRALLLAAPSGTGKSTLAYAARQAGYAVPADDVVYVQLQPGLRVWGAARALRVPPEARRWFPELRARAPVRGADGDVKLVIPLPSRAAPPATEVTVCLVRRGSGRGGMRPMGAGRIARALTADLETGFDRFQGRMNRVVARLSRGGGYQLTLSRDPNGALPYLDRLLGKP